MPAEYRVRCDQCGDRSQSFTAEPVTKDRQAPPLAVGEAEPLASELGSEGLILRDQIRNGVGFALLQPRGEHDVQAAPTPVKHAGRIAQKMPNSWLGSVLGHYVIQTASGGRWKDASSVGDTSLNCHPGATLPSKRFGNQQTCSAK